MAKKTKMKFVTNAEAEKTLHKNLKFTALEQYKLLRTNLQFTLPEDVDCPIIGVTSSVRGEGKSTTAINLAYAIAESGKKVLLIDADLRIPSIAQKMEMDGTVGLTDMLLANNSEIKVYQTKLMDNWCVLPAGCLPPNPSELLGSHRMQRLLNKLADGFDYIVLDLPPVNVVSDALAISSYLTGMIIVVREGYSEKKELANCIRQIKLSNVKVLGTVINETQIDKKHYSKYKNYYKSRG